MSTPTTASAADAALSQTTRQNPVITSFPFLPLTTTFTPTANDCGGILLPRSPPIYVIDHDPSCLPPGFSTSNPSFFYSPGIACPAGYWTACHDTTGASSITTVTCCPAYGDISLSCVPSPLALSSVWASLYCTWIAPGGEGTAVTVTKSDDGRTSTVTERVTAPGGVNAYGVRMVYQQTDLAATGRTPTTARGDGETSTASPRSSDPAAGSGGSEGGGLSTGAKAAIGVVVPLVVLAAVLAGFLLWQRRRRRKTTQEQQLQGYAGEMQLGDQQGKPQGVYSSYYGERPPVQQYPQEMPGQWQPPELPNTRAAAELPTESPRA
ncbi:hypothetical protein VTI74DRAFT_3152 [Chaetomium olivicolor]